MKIHKIKSHAKINLNLNIIGRLPNKKMHKVESLISFIKLADIIKISENKSNKHSVVFDGKFSKDIQVNYEKGNSFNIWIVIFVVIVLIVLVSN